MGFLGVLEDKHLRHVPATVVLAEEEHQMTEATAGLKHGTGKDANIILIPQPYQAQFSPRSTLASLTVLQLLRPQRPAQLVLHQKALHHGHHLLRVHPLCRCPGTPAISSSRRHRSRLPKAHRRRYSDIGLHVACDWRKWPFHLRLQSQMGETPHPLHIQSLRARRHHRRKRSVQLQRASCSANPAGWLHVRPNLPTRYHDTFRNREKK
jgi:hypothetical protein